MYVCLWHRLLSQIPADKRKAGRQFSLAAAAAVADCIAITNILMQLTHTWDVGRPKRGRPISFAWLFCNPKLLSVRKKRINNGNKTSNFKSQKATFGACVSFLGPISWWRRHRCSYLRPQAHSHPHPPSKTIPPPPFSTLFARFSLCPFSTRVCKCNRG